MMMFVSLILMMTVGAIAAPKELSDFFKDKTTIEKPFELRDPFKAPFTKADKDTDKAGYYATGKGQYSNIKENTVKSIDDIRVVGVLIGRERRAMVSNGANKEIIIMKEGMQIGEDGAELKAILPGGIIIVEKIVNVYGQVEYLETVIPISK